MICNIKTSTKTSKKSVIQKARLICDEKKEHINNSRGKQIVFLI